MILELLNALKSVRRLTREQEQAIRVRLSSDQDLCHRLSLHLDTDDPEKIAEALLPEED